MEPGELNPDTSLGTLTLNGQSLATWHVALSNLGALLDDFDVRGGNRLISHAVGTLARRKRRTVTRKDFPIAFTGLYTSAGVRVASGQRYPQLVLNVEAWRAAVGIGESAPAGNTGTVTLEWNRSTLGLSNKTADVHVITPMRLAQHGFVMTGTLSLDFPEGGWN